jgi:lipoate-protein ligase B
MTAELAVDWLGRVAYREALEIQEKAVEARRRGAAGDRLLLLEHLPVVTLGRRADGSNLRRSPAELAERGVEVISVARGGDVTWHGPGQLVGYAVLDLAARGEPDVHRHLRNLEVVLIEALASFGVQAARIPDMTGVYVDGSRPPRKLASIGVGVRGWVTWHGFALNVTNPPESFADIVPCGLHQVEMTSVAREADEAPTPALFEAVREAVAASARRRLS